MRANASNYYPSHTQFLLEISWPYTHVHVFPILSRYRCFALINKPKYLSEVENAIVYFAGQRDAIDMELDLS